MLPAGRGRDCLPVPAWADGRLGLAACPREPGDSRARHRQLAASARAGRTRIQAMTRFGQSVLPYSACRPYGRPVNAAPGACFTARCDGGTSRRCCPLPSPREARHPWRSRDAARSPGSARSPQPRTRHAGPVSVPGHADLPELRHSLRQFATQRCPSMNLARDTPRVLRGHALILLHPVPRTRPKPSFCRPGYEIVPSHGGSGGCAHSGCDEAGRGTGHRVDGQGVR